MKREKSVRTIRIVRKIVYLAYCVTLVGFGLLLCSTLSAQQEVNRLLENDKTLAGEDGYRLSNGCLVQFTGHVVGDDAWHTTFAARHGEQIEKRYIITDPEGNTIESITVSQTFDELKTTAEYYQLVDGVTGESHTLTLTTVRRPAIITYRVFWLIVACALVRLICFRIELMVIRNVMTEETHWLIVYGAMR